MKYNKKEHKDWSKKIREVFDNRCAICGIKSGDINKNGKKIILDSHHLVPKVEHRYDVGVGILLCKNHHKFNKTCSAHGSGLLFFEIIKVKYEKLYQYCLNILKSEFETENDIIVKKDI